MSLDYPNREVQFLWATPNQIRAHLPVVRAYLQSNPEISSVQLGGAYRLGQPGYVKENVDRIVENSGAVPAKVRMYRSPLATT